jgi:hypothetical protein
LINEVRIKYENKDGQKERHAMNAFLDKNHCPMTIGTEHRRAPNKTGRVTRTKYGPGVITNKSIKVRKA